MLTSEIIAQVRRVQLRTGRQVADVLSGAYHSVFRGRGMEFEEVRPYVPGDDVRAIDWNVTARVGEPYIKRYVEERELTVMLLVDVSGSQDFGSNQRSKAEAAVELSALLAFSASQNQDKVGLLLFHGHAETYIPPRKGQKHALRVVREVLARGRQTAATDNEFRLSQRVLRRFAKLVERTRREPRRSTNIAQALEFCQNVLSRKVVLFVISDFIDTNYVSVLLHANRKHDVVCSLITDERELSMPPAGLLTLQDAESGVTRVVDTSSPAFQRQLEARARDRVEGLRTQMRAAGIDLVHVDATQPVVDPLLRFFRMRERRLRR